MALLLKSKLVCAFAFIFVVAFVFTAPQPAQAEIYKWIDANGKVHFSDEKPEHMKVEEIKLEINTFENVSYDLSLFDTGGKVIMYSTDWCSYCKKARRYFRKNNIAYTEYDIEKDSRARRQYKKMGATGVPVILVGKKRMNGFSVSGFQKIYGK